MQSDILVMFKTAQSDAEISKAKSCLMNVHRSVTVHQKEGAKRVLLVKYDPKGVAPAHLLEAINSAGFDVSIAGG